MDVENIIANSRTIKQLSRDIATIAKNSGGGGSPASGGISGINRVDQKIDDIKDAFKNNSTVKFMTDPAAVLGEGFKGVMKPFTSFLPNMVDEIKKFNPFSSGNKGVAKSLDKLEKATTKNTKLLSSILQQNTASPDEISAGIAEGLGQTVLRDSIRDLELQQSSLKEISKLRVQFAVLPEQIAGTFLSPVNKLIGASQTALSTGFNKIFKKDSAIDAHAGEQLSLLHSEISQFGKINDSDKETMMAQKQAHHSEQINALSDLQMGSAADKLSAGHLSNIESVLLGDTDINQEKLKFDIAERKRLAALDQTQAEAKRDDVNRQTEFFENLGMKLDALGDAMGDKDAKTAKKSGGIFDWIKKNFVGIGGGLAIGAGVAVKGISGLFLGMINTLSEGFRILGRRRAMVTRGAGVLALMGLSLIPFAGSLALLNKAMNGFTIKKVGVFAAMLGVLGTAVAGFALAISTGIGGVAVAGAIGLLALLGAALIPFGKAISLAGDGIRPAAELFSALADVKWSSFFLAGPALNALAGALRGFKGLPDVAGDSSSALGMIDGIGDKITASLPGAAKPIQDFNTALSGLSSITLDDSIGTALGGIYKAVDKRDFKKRLESAGEGMKSLLGDINSELNKINETALDKVTRLLNGSQNANALMSSINNTGEQMNAASTNRINPVGGSFVNVDNSTGGSNTNIQVTQQTMPHINDVTLGLLGT